MRKLISTPLITALAIAALGGTAGVATAKQAADDPIGHVRHGQGVDDPIGQVCHTGADDSKARTSRSGHRRVRHGRGADDRAGRVRHSRGTDDGPNHS